MAYRKFDDPAVDVNDSRMKTYDAFQLEATRRAIQGISNRVMAGTSGTGYSPFNTAGFAVGTIGSQFTTELLLCLNGAVKTIELQDNIRMPYGTQGLNTVAKYLFVSNGTSGTVRCVGPGNIIDKGDYSTIALANTAAKLPDLPDNHVALGMLTLNAPTLTNVVFAVSSTLGTTGGTATYADLICMPYDG